MESVTIFPKVEHVDFEASFVTLKIICSVCAKANPFMHAPKSAKKSQRMHEQVFTFLNMYSRIKILEITTDMNKGFL